MNKHASTPWQTWAQDYSSDPENGIYDDHVDNEDADRYAHASWEACKARVLEILKSHVEPVCVDLFDDAYISLKALKDIESL